MVATSLKKIETLNQKIEQIKAEKKKIEEDVVQEIAKNLVHVLKTQDAFTLDINSLIGGLLDVVQKSKIDTKLTEEWKIAGEQFRKSFSKSHGRKTKKDATKKG